MSTEHADIIVVADAVAAKEELANRKDMFPEVPSAYVPSGRSPAIGILLMGVASILGGILAAVAAGIALVIAWVSTLGFYTWVDDNRVLVGLLLLLGSLVVGALFAIVALGLVGYVPTLVVDRAALRGKNRSPRIAALFAIAGAAFATGILLVIVYQTLGTGLPAVVESGAWTGKRLSGGRAGLPSGAGSASPQRAIGLLSARHADGFGGVVSQRWVFTSFSGRPSGGGSVDWTP